MFAFSTFIHIHLTGTHFSGSAYNMSFFHLFWYQSKFLSFVKGIGSLSFQRAMIKPNHFYGYWSSFIASILLVFFLFTICHVDSWISLLNGLLSSHWLVVIHIFIIKTAQCPDLPIIIINILIVIIIIIIVYHCHRHC